MTEDKLAHYMALPYSVEVTPDEEGGFNAAIPALKGCVALGETTMEAHVALDEVKRIWFETAVERGWRILEPPPPGGKTYSGEFRVRLPRYLHGALAHLADAQGTSLNQLVVDLLSEGAERLRLGHVVARESGAPEVSLPSYRPQPVATAIAAEPSADYDGDPVST